MFLNRLTRPVLSAVSHFPALTRSLGTFLHRPTIFPASPAGLSIPTTTPTSMTGITATIAPRISDHPALRALQVRNGPRNTFDPSHRVRKRRYGFLARRKTRTGRMILMRRREKGRKSLTH
ncbi:hypothetical protein RUND412_006667 [Rhizina undulata]